MDDSLLRTRVLIVGAGPVGLALAIELGHRNIPCLLIERNDRVGYAPRAKTTNVRTREHFRRWGIAEKLRAASPLGLDYPSNVVFCTRLAGHELTRFENAFYCAPGRNPLYSEHAQWVPQYTVEEVMRAHAQSLPGVQIRFNCELKSFSQNGTRVQSIARELKDGRDLTIEADYLVGADGARSLVRDGIGAKLEGTYGLSRNYNVVFRATGIDLPYEVLSTDEWVASRFIGDFYRDRRVFLAGDACHLHPPFGGYGMNMGVADGVDLGWKLASVLQGWGGAQLLDSYERERRQVHEMVLDEAVANHAMLGNQLWKEGMDADDETGANLRREVGSRIQAAKIREFATLGVVLGYHYENSPVIVPDGSARPGHDFINYIPSSRPGAVAPHAWLHDGSSLYDAFGNGFTLLAAPDVPSEAIDQVRLQAKNAGVPLKVIQPSEAGVAELYPTRFTLIRPDQHVAWRGDAWPQITPGLFEQVTGRAKSLVTAGVTQ